MSISRTCRLNTAVALLTVIWAGCVKNADSPGSTTRPGPNIVESETPSTHPKQEVRYQLLSWDETQQLVADQKGKVVVLDVWSTSCIPCMKEFPNLVKLQEKYGDKVACISFNIDFFGDTEAPSDELKHEVMKFLLKQNAAIVNVISMDPDDAVYSQIDAAAIPAVFVYDREGKLSKRFADQEFTYESDINPVVEELVSAEGG